MTGNCPKSFINSFSLAILSYFNVIGLLLTITSPPVKSTQLGDGIKVKLES